MLFSAACVASSVAFQLVASGDSGGTGPMGALAALTEAAALITGVIAWIAAVVLAFRSGSLLWLVIAILPIVPINALLCAMFCPASRSDRRR